MNKFKIAFLIFMSFIMGNALADIGTICVHCIAGKCAFVAEVNKGATNLKISAGETKSFYVNSAGDGFLLSAILGKQIGPGFWKVPSDVAVYSTIDVWGVASNPKYQIRPNTCAN